MAEDEDLYQDSPPVICGNEEKVAIKDSGNKILVNKSDAYKIEHSNPVKNNNKTEKATKHKKNASGNPKAKMIKADKENQHAFQKQVKTSIDIPNNKIVYDQQLQPKSQSSNGETPAFFKMIGNVADEFRKITSIFVPSSQQQQQSEQQSQPQQQQFEQQSHRQQEQFEQQSQPQPQQQPQQQEQQIPFSGYQTDLPPTSLYYPSEYMNPNPPYQYNNNPAILQLQWQNQINQLLQNGQQPPGMPLSTVNSNMPYPNSVASPVRFNMPSLEDIGFNPENSEAEEHVAAQHVAPTSNWYSIIFSGPTLALVLSIGALIIGSRLPTSNDGLIDHINNSILALVNSCALVTVLVSSVVILFKSLFLALPGVSSLKKQKDETHIPAGQSLSPEQPPEPQVVDDQPLDEFRVRNLIESYLFPMQPPLNHQMYQEQPNMMFEQPFPMTASLPTQPLPSPVHPHIAQALPQMISQIYPQVNGFASPMPMQIPSSPINPFTQQSFSKPTMQEFMAKMHEMPGDYKNFYGDENSDDEKVELIPAGELIGDENKRNIYKRDLGKMHVLDLIKDNQFREEILEEEETAYNGSYIDVPPLPNIDDPYKSRTIRGNYSDYITSESMLNQLSKPNPLVKSEAKDVSSGKSKQNKTINNTNLAVNWNEPIGKKQKEAAKVKKNELKHAVIKNTKGQKVKEVPNKDTTNSYYVDDYACKPYGPPPNRYQGVLI